MGFRYDESQIEVVDALPSQFRKFHKKQWDGASWVDTNYIEIPRTMDRVTWLGAHYGSAKYQGNWWCTQQHVIMTEKVYTHWRLAN